MKLLVYHVVTECPMHAGQRIVFDENHPNGVCRRVRAWEAIQRGEDVEPELRGLILSNPARWAQVARRELAMEQVRRERFPEYPSRMACLYTSRTLEEARSWAKFFQMLGRKVYSIVLLEVNGRIFDGDACNCFDGVGNETDLSNALLYWQNAPTEKPVIETIVDGEIIVKEMIETFMTE